MEMSAIYEARKERLRQVMVERFDGRQIALAASLGKEPNYISRIFGGTKKIGEEIARYFEERLGKPPYWLDGSLTNLKLASSNHWPFPIPYERYEALPQEKKQQLSDRVVAFIEGALPIHHSKKVANGH